MAKSLKGYYWKGYASTTTADTYNATRFQLGSEVGKSVTKTTFRRGKIYKTEKVKVMLIDGIVHYPVDNNTSDLISMETVDLRLHFQILSDEKTALVFVNDKDEIHTFEIHTADWGAIAAGAEQLVVGTGQGADICLTDIPIEPLPIFDPDVWIAIDSENAGQKIDWYFKIFYHYEHWSPNKVTKWGKTMA